MKKSALKCFTDFNAQLFFLKSKSQFENVKFYCLFEVDTCIFSAHWNRRLSTSCDYFWSDKTSAFLITGQLCFVFNLGLVAENTYPYLRQNLKSESNTFSGNIASINCNMILSRFMDWE